MFDPTAPIDRKAAERYLARVDDWVGRFHSGEETLLEEAYEVEMKLPHEKTATDNLGHAFFLAVGEYDRAKVNHPNHENPIELRIVYNAALCVQTVVDKARTMKLLQPNDMVRKFADCTEKSVELEKRLQQAHRRIADLENLVRLLGGDPDSASNTFSGDVKGATGSDE